MFITVCVLETCLIILQCLGSIVTNGANGAFTCLLPVYYFAILIGESFHCGLSCLVGNITHVNIFYRFFHTPSLHCGNSFNLRLLLLMLCLLLLCLGYGFYVQGIVNPMDVLKIFVKKRDPDMAIR